MIKTKGYSEDDLKYINEIQSFLDENGIYYTTEYGNFCLLDKNDPDKRKYEIEYVPAIKFPMEYSKYGIEGVPKDYFFKLSYEAEHNNSFKLWIKQFEWENERQREVLKSYILHAAHKTPFKWYARECEIKIVSTKEGRPFEDKHCFYGRRGASLSLGLYSKKMKNGIPAGTLIMIYTFGKNFFGKKEGVIEVLRVGTRRFSYVTGGSSKLFKHFVNNYKQIQIGKNLIDVKQIKFYSDYDHNIGRSMKNLGFDFTGYSEGGFLNYWKETKTVKHRQPMKHKWVMEQMKEGKVLSIPNAGVKTYIYNCNGDN